MSISTETRKAGPFTCDGVVVAFPFSFKVFSAADVRVILLDTLAVEADLTLTTDYSVSLNADQDTSPGGTVTTVSTYATGNYITLSSKLTYTQPTKLTNSGGFYPGVINDALDRATIQIQQLEDKVSRAAMLPISGLGSLNPASLFFGVNAAGTAAELKLITDLGASLAVISPFMLAVLESVSQADARTALLAAKSGANTDITSLSSPALANATANTQAATDNSTKVATTAFSQAIVAAVPRIAVRQTVLSGPVDSSGNAALGGSTGATSVTAAGTIIATSSQGHGVSGDVDRVGSITNPVWTGLSTNGTMYLFVDIAADGTCTTASSTLAPVYQLGGTPAVTNGQFTFNIQQMTAYVGNGSAAAAAYRVCVGEVTVSAGVVSAITWYAYQGRYRSADTAWPAAGTAVSLNHNIGALCLDPPVVTAVCQTNDVGYLAGDVVVPYTLGNASFPSPIVPWKNNLLCGFTTGSITSMQLINKTSGAHTSATTANWKYRVQIKRGW